MQDFPCLSSFALHWKSGPDDTVCIEFFHPKDSSHDHLVQERAGCHRPAEDRDRVSSPEHLLVLSVVCPKKDTDCL